MSNTDATAIATVAPVLDDVALDVPQVANLLRVGRNTVYSLVARNQIPHKRLGKAIRFSRTALMSWLSQQ